MVYAAGQKVRAAELQDDLFLLARQTADLSKTSDTALANATGLAVVLAANTRYAIEGFLSYSGAAAGDLKVALTAPSGSAGSWTLFALSSAVTASPGTVDATVAPGFGSGNSLTRGCVGAGVTLGAMLRGYILTAATAGPLQVQAAQGAASATATLLLANSWLRLLKIDS